MYERERQSVCVCSHKITNTLSLKGETERFLSVGDGGWCRGAYANEPAAFFNISKLHYALSTPETRRIINFRRKLDCRRVSEHMLEMDVKEAARIFASLAHSHAGSNFLIS
jgi:hypothetical protein